MKFKKVKDEWYPEFYIEKSGLYSIGVAQELFSRMKIQVMYCEQKGGNWWVIREYVSYKRELIDKQLKRIYNVLKDEEGLVKWKKVEGLIPLKDKKYLEDKM